MALRGVLAVVALIAATPVLAQTDYTTRTVTVVAPSAPGGLYSLFARLIGTRLEQRLGKAFIVENRPGAASLAGAVSVARSTPDGYTLLVATSTTMATNVGMHKKLPYDPVADFVPIALIARIPEVLVVTPALPIRSVADLAKLTRETPGGLSVGSSGVGTAQHLDAEVFKSALGIPLTHVPYKGASPAINDVAAGHIAMMFSPIPLALPLVEAGKLRAIGVTTAQRVEAMPDVPPLAEIGVPGFDTSAWFMLVAPAKTPDAIVEKLHAEMKTFIADVDVRRELIRQGAVPVVSPPLAELKRFVQSEITHWGEVVRKAGLAGTD